MRKFYDLVAWGGGGSIKEQCESQYEQIKKAEDRLKELRSICKHESVFQGNYSYRIGSVLPALICSDCGSLIDNTKKDE